MRSQPNSRRSYGTGSLFTSHGKWYGKWRVDDRQVKRLLGAKRQPGSREGLTRKMAEVELRRAMGETRPVKHTDAVTFDDAAFEFLRHRRRFGRSTTRPSPTTRA